MPGIHIHLAIGKRYIEKHRIKNEKEFLEGIIAPDFAEVKYKSHYGAQNIISDVAIDHAKNKVNIESYLKSNKIETDYEKGVYLHLLTDKMFYDEFFADEYLKNTSHMQFCRDLYYSYDITNPYVVDKYNIVFTKEESERIAKNIAQAKKIKDEKCKIDLKEKNIIPLDKLYAFIEKMSDINLD